MTGAQYALAPSVDMAGGFSGLSSMLILAYLFYHLLNFLFPIGWKFFKLYFFFFVFIGPQPRHMQVLRPGA